MRAFHINRAAGRIRYRRENYYSIFFAVFQGGTKTKLHNFYRFSELILYITYYTPILYTFI